jgi:hypothetical protein
MLKLRKDLQCTLQDKNGTALLEFSAQQVGDAVYNAGFEGGGVASGSQMLTIMTACAYDYNPLKHHVIIDGRKWIITSVTPTIRHKLGARIGAKTHTIYVLALE